MWQEQREVEECNKHAYPFSEWRHHWKQSEALPHPHLRPDGGPLTLFLVLSWLGLSHNRVMLKAEPEILFFQLTFTLSCVLQAPGVAESLIGNSPRCGSVVYFYE